MTKAPAGNRSSRRFFVAEKNNFIFVSVFPYFFAFYKIGGFMPRCSLKIEKSTLCALPCIVFATTGTAASGEIQEPTRPMVTPGRTGMCAGRSVGIL